MMADYQNFPRAPGDTRTDEERVAVAERFSDDPSRGLVAFNPDGSFDWPSGWSLDQKIRAIDRSRRGGNPNRLAMPLGESNRVDRMVEKLRTEFGDGIYTKIEAVQRENDTRVKEFRSWKAQKEAISAAKIIPFRQISPIVAPYIRKKSPLYVIEQHDYMNMIEIQGFSSYSQAA